LPKAPVLGWSCFVPPRRPAGPSVGDLRHRRYTTSGRAALLAALRQLSLPAGSTVLVPTYHCPTMVAPVLEAGLVPAYFPIGPQGLPEIDGIDRTAIDRARVIIAAQYFGLPRGLSHLRQWCDRKGIVLVEDCAHSYFGQAGERPVGAWGDYATASISKFFPVAEAGLLASAVRPLSALGLRRPGLRRELKSALDVLEQSHAFGHLGGIRHLLDPVLRLRSLKRARSAAMALEPQDLLEPSEQEMMGLCDMGRTGEEATWAARALHAALPQAGIVQRRRDNYAALASALAQPSGARLLEPVLPDGAVPYVCPLLIEGRERAQAIYMRMRAAGLPVFRWDRIWPGTPADPQDCGPTWSHQLIQILCHQSLTPEQLRQVAAQTQALLRSH